MLLTRSSLCQCVHRGSPGIVVRRWRWGQNWGHASGMEISSHLLVAVSSSGHGRINYRRRREVDSRRAQRAIARKQEGSNRRKKAVQRFAKAHLHVANQRRNFHHQVAHQLISQYGMIALGKGYSRCRLGPIPQHPAQQGGRCWRADCRDPTC